MARTKKSGRKHTGGQGPKKQKNRKKAPLECMEKIGKRSSAIQPDIAAAFAAAAKTFTTADWSQVLEKLGLLFDQGNEHTGGFLYGKWDNSTNMFVQLEPPSDPLVELAQEESKMAGAPDSGSDTTAQSGVGPAGASANNSVRLDTAPAASNEVALAEVQGDPPVRAPHSAAATRDAAAHAKKLKNEKKRHKRMSRYLRAQKKEAATAASLHPQNSNAPMIGQQPLPSFNAVVAQQSQSQNSSTAMNVKQPQPSNDAANTQQDAAIAQQPRTASKKKSKQSQHTAPVFSKKQKQAAAEIQERQTLVKREQTPIKQEPSAVEQVHNAIEYLLQ